MPYNTLRDNFLRAKGNFFFFFFFLLAHSRVFYRLIDSPLCQRNPGIEPRAHRECERNRHVYRGKPPPQTDSGSSASAESSAIASASSGASASASSGASASATAGGKKAVKAARDPVAKKAAALAVEETEEVSSSSSSSAAAAAGAGAAGTTRKRVVMDRPVNNYVQQLLGRSAPVPAPVPMPLPVPPAAAAAVAPAADLPVIGPPVGLQMSHGVARNGEDTTIV